MKKSSLPKFKNEDVERNYWSNFDMSKHFEAKDFQAVSFPNLKPSSRSISIRLPEYLLIRIKEQANELDVPYQSLMKNYLAQGALKRTKANQLCK